MRLASLLLALLATAPALAAPPPARFGDAEPPRLVVVIVVDQLRADYLGRFRAMLGDDGLGELVGRGAYWPYAEYDIIQAMTGPGHATVATGAWPSHHGIVLNSWVERATAAKVYCVEDASHRLVGASTPKHTGTSPRLLRAPTLGDALKNSGMPSRVVSIAVKDRAAILMGGRRADDVVWMHTDAMQWVSSDFYRPEGRLLPWLAPVNAALAKRRGEVFVWRGQGAPAGPSDDGPQAGFAETYRLGEHPQTWGTPFAPAALVDAALAAAAGHRLGADAVPDVLWISFSGFDKAGHGHGPNHRRMESMLAAIDAEVARLLDGLAAAVPGGRDAMVVALTGDHGVAPVPEYGAKHRLPTGRLDFDALPKTVEAALVKRFGKAPGGGAWVAGFRELNLYLSPRATAEHRAAAAEVVRGLGPVRFAYTVDDVAAGRLPPAPLDRRIGQQYDPVRSGDVMIVLQPYHIYDYGAASHLTGYAYDRLVPLVLMGRPFRAGLYGQSAQIIDLAMTLSFVLGIQPPAMAEGRVLHEALESPRP